MIGRSGAWDMWRAQNLRDKYRPKSRIGQSFLAAVPWIDVLLVCALFIWVGTRLTLRPGVVFELPPAPFQEGLYESITAVLIPISRNAQQSETLVFFDDERYSLADIQQVQRLGAAMRTLLSHTARRELLLLADRQVPHGDVMAAVNLARAAGVQRVNVGVKPD